MAEFTPIKTMSVKVNTPMTADGNIAQSGDTVKSSKAISFPGISAQATLAESATVIDAFLNIAGGSFDSLSAKRTMTGGVTA